VEARLEEQLEVYRAATDKKLTDRIGQALEVAVYRGMKSQSEFGYLGGFLDLEEHDDDLRYKKQEPPTLIDGRKASSGPVDFIFQHQGVGNVGVEIKNVRPWIYPDSTEVKEFIRKCCELELVPVLIARRISYVARAEVFRPCGIVVHETYNQLYPRSAVEVAERARDKRLLGYHDIRLGNEPDERLQRFLHENLPSLLPKAREKFQEPRDILEEYAGGRIRYVDFHVELRTRMGMYDLPEEAYLRDDESDE
jgi:hypothetical protein